MPPRPDTTAQREAITRAAQEVGMDPSLALAIAERESEFNPQARSSKTIRGMYQMTGKARVQHGVGDSDDPAVQTKGWVPFFRQVQKEMAGPLGRAPTDTEGYLGHHFGGVRAGRMMKMDPATPVDTVFTPREMAENPHLAKAGTVGQVNSSLLADIDKRRAKFGGQAPALGLIDFASQGAPVEGLEAGIPDFSHASDQGEKINMASPASGLSAGQGAAGSPTGAAAAPDFSNFGVPAS